MSTLKVNNIESFTGQSAVIVNDALTVTGSNSIKFDLNCLPTSSANLETGTLYRTGSSYDEIKIKL